MKSAWFPMLFAVALLAVAPASTAYAYVGPGAGLGAIGALIAVLATVLMAIGAVLWWPMRHMMRRRKQIDHAHHREIPADKGEKSSTAEGNSFD